MPILNYGCEVWGFKRNIYNFAKDSSVSKKPQTILFMESLEEQIWLQKWPTNSEYWFKALMCFQNGGQ